MRSFLSPKETFAVLSSAGSVLDPEGTSAQNTYAIVGEPTRFSNVRSLTAAIGLSLASSTFRELCPDARGLSGVVAFFPQGVNGGNIEWLLPTTSDGPNTFDEFCTSLLLGYRMITIRLTRQKMWHPARLYHSWRTNGLRSAKATAFLATHITPGTIRGRLFAILGSSVEFRPLSKSPTNCFGLLSLADVWSRKWKSGDAHASIEYAAHDQCLMMHAMWLQVTSFCEE